MLKTRTMVALVLLGVAALAVVITRSKKDQHARELGAPAAAGAPKAIAKADVDGLEIGEPGQAKIVLKKDGEAWKLVEPVADKADPEGVDAALAVLAELSFQNVVAESKTSH